MSESQNNTTVIPEKSKRNIPWTKILVAGIVILITVLAFGLIAYLMIGENNTKESNQNVETQISIPTSTPDPYADWETYESSYDSFTLKYPTTLEILEDEYNEKPFRTFIQNDNLQLVINPNGLTGESTLSAYQANLETLGANNFSPYNISGENALKYNLIAKGEETIEVITIHNGKAYVFSFSYSDPEQVQYLDQILSTFKFTDITDIDSLKEAISRYIQKTENVELKTDTMILEVWELENKDGVVFVKVNVSDKDSFGGFAAYAFNDNQKWNIAFTGQDDPPCNLIKNFPTEIVKLCFDDNENPVQR